LAASTPFRAAWVAVMCLLNGREIGSYMILDNAAVGTEE
jgi:hypothetical protein